MAEFLIFFVGLGAVIALVALRWEPRDPWPGKPQRSTGQKIALGIAVALGALGLFVVAFIAYFMIAMNSWANNK